MSLNRLALMAASALLLALLTVAVAAAQDPAGVVTPLGKNLVQNAGAEAVTGTPDGYTVVDIPRWTHVGNFTLAPYGGSGLPGLERSRAIHGGKYFFSGGPNNSSSSAYQVRRLLGLSGQVDSGSLRLSVAAWLAGWDAQRDTARVVVQFLGSGNKVLGAVRTAPVSATDTVFVKKTASAAVPKGTRLLKVVLVAARGDGVYNDGYFDKIDVRLVQAP